MQIQVVKYINVQEVWVGMKNLEVGVGLHGLLIIEMHQRDLLHIYMQCDIQVQLTVVHDHAFHIMTWQPRRPLQCPVFSKKTIIKFFIALCKLTIPCYQLKFINNLFKKITLNASTLAIHNYKILQLTIPCNICLLVIPPPLNQGEHYPLHMLFSKFLHYPAVGDLPSIYEGSHKLTWLNAS